LQNIKRFAPSNEYAYLHWPQLAPKKSREKVNLACKHFFV
jgi:hypothetical protein